MTEATTSTYIPQLIYLTSQQEIEPVVKKLLLDQFGPVKAEHLQWVNKDQGTFTIDMVRELIHDLSYAAFGGKTRHVILVSIDQASIEAQNSMLKLLEEPPVNTQIWLTARTPQKILPTIISRSQEILLPFDGTYAVSEAATEVALKIPKLSYRELSDLAGEYSEREEAKQLVDALILYIHHQMRHTNATHHIQSLKTLLQTIQYLEANVNVRLALEHCFFSLKKDLSSTTNH